MNELTCCVDNLALKVVSGAMGIFAPAGAKIPIAYFWFAGFNPLTQIRIN
jgi:hypothetical protein